MNEIIMKDAVFNIAVFPRFLSAKLAFSVKKYLLVGLRPGMMPNESAVPANSTSEQADLSTKKAFPMFRISEVGLYGEQPGRRGEKGNADQAAL